MLVKSGLRSWNELQRLDYITSLCNPRDHCTHSLFQDYCIVKLITPTRLTFFTQGHNFVAGNSIVRTRPQNHAWDHCGETSAYKTTQPPLLHTCLNEWDDLMWSLRLCNSLGEASPYKVTWLHRLITGYQVSSSGNGCQVTCPIEVLLQGD